MLNGKNPSSTTSVSVLEREIDPELNQDDFARELTEAPPRNPSDFNDKETETYQKKKRALLRMGDLGLSVNKYVELVKRDSQEREYLDLPEKGGGISRASIFRWKKKADAGQKSGLARGRGGVGKKTRVPNWVSCFILEKLNVDPKAGCTDIHKKLKPFADHYDYYLPVRSTIWRFKQCIKSKGGLQDMLRKMQTRRYFSAYQMAVRHIYSHSNHVWETDATKLSIRIAENTFQGNRTKKTVQLLLTVDCFSGLIIGWTILLGDPNTTDLIRHLHHCLVRGEDKNWGGKPVTIQSDNAKIYYSKGFLATCEDLGIELTKSPPYCPAYNGCIERLNQTFKATLNAQFIQVVKRYRLFSESDEVFLGTFEQLKETVAECVLDYNTVRGPSGKKGNYYSIWAAGLKKEEDGYCDKVQADRYCLRYEDMKVSRQGVFVGGAYWFTHEILESYVGREIPVRYNLVGAPSYVIARIGGKWVRLEDPTSSRFNEACKKARELGLPALAQIQETINENALSSMHVHSPGTAKAMKEKKAKPLPANLPAPSKALVIPDLPTAKIHL